MLQNFYFTRFGAFLFFLRAHQGEQRGPRPTDTRGSAPNHRFSPKGPDMVRHGLRKGETAGPARKRPPPPWSAQRGQHTSSPDSARWHPPALAAGHNASTVDFSSSDLAQPGPLRVTHRASQRWYGRHAPFRRWLCRRRCQRSTAPEGNHV